MSIYPDLPFVHALGDGGTRGGTQVIVIHATDGNGTAANEASYATHRPDKTSAHFYVDAGQTIQALNTTHIAYGCLSHGNAISVQFELCGLSNHLSDATMRRAAQTVARVCKEFGIPARKIGPGEVTAGVKGIVGHADITLAFPQDHGDHTDPGASFPWATFINYVQGGTDMANAAETNASRNAWAVAQLQTSYKVIPGDADGAAEVTVSNPLKAKLDAIAMDAKAAASLSTTVTMTEADRAAIVADLAKLVPSAADIAVAVLDEQHRRDAA